MTRLEYYPFTYEIDYWLAPKRRDEMRQWVEDMCIPCTHINRTFFFTTDEDRLLFILRWSE